ncbi:RNA 2'-phosphotransferase [Burkholderia sp. PU8-34]
MQQSVAVCDGMHKDGKFARWRQETGARHHVHLLQDLSTAIAVGKRYGNPVVLAIDARRMHEQRFAFFLAEYGVWLADAVPAAFLSVLDTPAA